MRRFVPILLVAAALPACQQESAPVAPELLQAGRSPAGEFTTQLTMTNFFMLPADPENPMGGASTFGGRCSEASTWISVFGVEGTIPQVGRVSGSASHCSRFLGEPVDGHIMTYADGVAWMRNASGDDLFLVYGNGVTFPPDATGYAIWMDDWTITGGTGRFDGVTGTGVDSGTVHLETAQAPPYVMRGTLHLSPSARPATPPLRGSVTAQWDAPWFASGNLAEDPCALEQGPGWVTNIMTGSGNATHIGSFTGTGSWCMNLMTLARGEMRFVGTTRGGDTFEWVVDEEMLDLPVLVPGLDRVYSNWMHGVLTGLTGRLAGARGEIRGVGKMDARWDVSGAMPVPVTPWAVSMDWSGWLEPGGRAR